MGGGYIYGGSDPRFERCPNSIHKVVTDMFLHPTCYQLFYTNDIYVLIDIIVRQLADLSCREPARRVYVDMCRLVLQHTDYDEHLHRFKDLERCFMRILEEDGEEEGGSAVRDKKVVEQVRYDAAISWSISSSLIIIFNFRSLRRRRHSRV